MNFKKILLLNILLTSFTFSNASETLNPIVVSNSISPIDLHSSPASMEVFTALDIEERGFANLQELLGINQLYKYKQYRWNWTIDFCFHQRY
jgi:outer membrane receptor for ferrienterochelin and colicin